MTDWFTQFGLQNPNEVITLVKTVLRILLIIGVAYVLNRLSKRGLSLLRQRLSQRAANHIEETKRLNTLSMVLRYCITTLIFAISGIEILHELGISIAPVLAAAGVVGLAIGFGAQSLVKDYFNGFFLLLENQIRKDDVIEVANKTGLVEEVTLRYIRMRDDEGNVHFVPNGQIITVTNKSRDFAFAVIDIGVGYKENIARIMALMQETAEKLHAMQPFNASMLDEPEIAGVDSVSDTTVVIRCRFKVRPLEQTAIRREYLKRIKEVFEQHEVVLKLTA